MYRHPSIIWMETTCAKAKSRLQRERWHDLLCFQIHQWTLLCFQIHECNMNEAVMETSMGPWPWQRHRWTNTHILSQPLWEPFQVANLGLIKNLATFSSLHCDCVSQIAISFSPVSQSRLCFIFSSFSFFLLFLFLFLSSIAISFSPVSQSRLCFCGQFDNQRNRTSLGRTSMKLTCQKYNSPFPGKLNPPRQACGVKASIWEESFISVKPIPPSEHVKVSSYCQITDQHP